jgi:hypothetical protein
MAEVVVDIGGSHGVVRHNARFGRASRPDQGSIVTVVVKATEVIWRRLILSLMYTNEGKFLPVLQRTCDKTGLAYPLSGIKLCALRIA